MSSTTQQWELPGIFAGDPAEAAAELHDYFRGRRNTGGPLYTGSQFHLIGAQEDSPDAFTASDIVAVSTLSVDVPARASIDLLLGDGRTRASELLRRLPPGVGLADPGAEALISQGGPAWELWDLLRSYHDVGRTVASKLMARKRPRLIPIQDTVVVRVLGHHRGWNFWERMRHQLHSRLPGGLTMLEWLRQAHSAAGLDPAIAELRVFDVLVWLNGTRAQPSLDGVVERPVG